MRTLLRLRSRGDAQRHVWRLVVVLISAMLPLAASGCATPSSNAPAQRQATQTPTLTPEQAAHLEQIASVKTALLRGTGNAYTAVPANVLDGSAHVYFTYHHTVGYEYPTIIEIPLHTPQGWSGKVETYVALDGTRQERVGYYKGGSEIAVFKPNVILWNENLPQPHVVTYGAIAVLSISQALALQAEENHRATLSTMKLFIPLVIASVPDSDTVNVLAIRFCGSRTNRAGQSCEDAIQLNINGSANLRYENGGQPKLKYHVPVIYPVTQTIGVFPSISGQQQVRFYQINFIDIPFNNHAPFSDPTDALQRISIGPLHANLSLANTTVEAGTEVGYYSGGNNMTVGLADYSQWISIDARNISDGTSQPTEGQVAIPSIQYHNTIQATPLIFV